MKLSRIRVYLNEVDFKIIELSIVYEEHQKNNNVGRSVIFEINENYKDGKFSYDQYSFHADNINDVKKIQKDMDIFSKVTININRLRSAIQRMCNSNKISINEIKSVCRINQIEVSEVNVTFF